MFLKPSKQHHLHIHKQETVQFFFYTHMSLNLGVIRCNNGTIVLKKVFVFFHYYFQQDLPFHGFKYFCHKRQTTLCMKTTPGKINK